jgi:hypothetical protein
MQTIHENGLQRKGVERGMLSALDSGSPVSKIDFALDARRRGLRVYPLDPNSTEPAFPEADCFATRDESQAKEWWKENPDRNIGIATDNLLVLRVKTASGATALGRLLLSRQETTKTARIILDCAGREQESCVLFSVPNGVNVEARSNIAAGVDVLGFDDVILGPGSVLNGTRCVFANEHPAAPAPLWLMELCGVELPAESKSMNVVALDKSAPVAVPTSIVSTSTKAAGKSKAAAPKTAAVKAAPPAAGRKEAAARDAATRGFDVFPIHAYVDPGDDATPEQREAAAKLAKAPLINHWQDLASQDPKQIKAWWGDWPDANIATTTEKFIVVDIDPRNGGKDTFEMLRLVDDFPDTATSNTQGGGNHLFYALPHGVRVKGGNSKLGPGVDIKSRGGYVLLPGSTIEGRAYAWADERPIALAPQWLIDRCKVSKPKTDAAGKRLVEEDDQAIELATNWMLKRAPTAEYGAIDDTTYKVAARVFDFGVSVETATDILLEWNELKCDPPGDVDRLLVVVESAGRNRENAIGSSHPLAPGFEAVEIDESKAPPLAPRETGIASPAEPLPDLIQTSAQFVQGFVPPEYLVDQVLQRRFCYSITAQTGVGKTAVAMLLSAHVAAGRSLGNLDVDQGTVLYFAGENPTDIQMRWLGITRELNLDPATADVHFVPGAMPLSQVASRIAEEVTRKGLRPALVVVDTAAAYFEGDDENSNTQAVAHARRMRALTELPGGPCVLILCHPTKRAADDDLIPRGGGAFLAEVDGNIALQKRESVIVASALGKFRGREFVPLSFELKTVRHPVLQDARGRPIPTVVARHLGEVERQRITTDTLGRENQLLKAVHDHPAASLRDLAEALGWRYRTGQPDQSKVTRALKALAEAKLLRQHGRRWQLTPAGEAELRPGQGVELAPNDGNPL